ncbi:MAG: hypothetical protein KDJ82_16010 [Rhodobacteraceae bacterium]|jgi:hypothetical protein|nr:hypothetical protein [Paracoccaceae bacterium]
MAQSVFHSPSGGFDLLGLRKGRQGGVEIIYDDGVARRMVWRVCGAVNEIQLGDALARAVRNTRVIPALYAELKKRSIAVEAVLG